MVAERGQAAADDRRGGQQRAEDDDAECEAGDGDPESAVGEEAGPVVGAGALAEELSLGFAFLGASLAQLGPWHPQCVDGAPAESFGAPEVAAGAGDAAGEGGDEGGAEFAGDGAGAFGEQVAEGAQHGERHEGQPVHAECPQRA